MQADQGFKNRAEKLNVPVSTTAVLCNKSGSNSPWSACRLGTSGSQVMLFAQDHAQEAIVNRQRAIARIVDKAHRPELVHEMTDPRSGGADHLGKVFLIDSRMDGFGSAFLAKTRQQ